MARKRTKKLEVKDGVRIPFERKKFRLSFTERVLGSLPSSDEVFLKYVVPKLDKDTRVKEFPELKEELVKEELKTLKRKVDDEEVEEERDSMLTIFHKMDGGIYLLDYQIKGFLKNSGNVLKDILGIRALRSKIDNFVFVYPRYIKIANEPDGIFVRSLRAQTAQGPRICVAGSEYVEPPCPIEIEIELLPHKEVKWETIYALLDYGSRLGIGQFRNGSFGRFTWEEIK